MASQASGQNAMKKSLGTYAGTWAGLSKQTLEQMQKGEGIHLYWRVHRIDTVKNEIDITQISQHFDDGSEIKHPKKETYKFILDGTVFSIKLNGHQSGSKYKLSLSPSEIPDMTALNGSFERLDKKTESKIFLFARTSDVISDYIKPEGKIEVLITPPPPVE